MLNQVCNQLKHHETNQDSLKSLLQNLQADSFHTALDIQKVQSGIKNDQVDVASYRKFCIEIQKESLEQFKQKLKEQSLVIDKMSNTVQQNKQSIELKTLEVKNLLNVLENQNQNNAIKEIVATTMENIDYNALLDKQSVKIFTDINQKLNNFEQQDLDQIQQKKIENIIKKQLENHDTNIYAQLNDMQAQLITKVKITDVKQVFDSILTQKNETIQSKIILIEERLANLETNQQKQLKEIEKGLNDQNNRWTQVSEEVDKLSKHMAQLDKVCQDREVEIKKIKEIIGTTNVRDFQQKIAEMQQVQCKINERLDSELEVEEKDKQFISTVQQKLIHLATNIRETEKKHRECYEQLKKQINNANRRVVENDSSDDDMFFYPN